MKAFRSLWATYDLTSFSLCELVKSFATTALKYHTEGPWSGVCFHPLFGVFCHLLYILSFSHLSSKRIRKKTLKLFFFLFSFYPEAHIQRLKSP